MKKPQDVFSAELLQWTVARRRRVSLLYLTHRQARCLFSDFKSTAYPVNKIRRRKLMNPQIQQALCNSVQGYIMEYKIADKAGHVCTAKVFTWAGQCIFSPEDTWKWIKCTDLSSLRTMQGSREILSFYCICVFPLNVFKIFPKPWTGTVFPRALMLSVIIININLTQ